MAPFWVDKNALKVKYWANYSNLFSNIRRNTTCRKLISDFVKEK